MPRAGSPSRRLSFFFSSRSGHTRFDCDWSSDVCSSDLFVLHDKLSQNSEAAFFELPGHAVYRVDKISWLRRLFDLSCIAFDRLNRAHDDPVSRLSEAFALGLDGVTEPEVRLR